MASGHLIHESGASIPCAVCNKSKDLFDHFSDPLHAEINKTRELTSTSYHWFLYDLVCFITEKVPMN